MMLGPVTTTQQRSNADKARAEALAYQKMTPEQKCAYQGLIWKKTWYARIYSPEAVDRLLTCRVCGMAPPPDGQPDLRPCQQCKPLRRVARMQQIPAWLRDPENRGEVSTHTFMGGRGSGKTMTCNGYIIGEMLTNPGMRAAYLGPDFKISVGVGIKGQSGIKTLIEQIDPSLILKWNDVKNILTLVNGSQVNCLSAKEPGSIEGEEYHLAWLDELAELAGQGGDDCVWRKRLEPCVRLPDMPSRALMSGTPEATLLIKDLHDSTEKWPDEYEWTQLATRENIANLDKKKVEKMYRESEGSAFAQQKLEGHLILESPHALLSEADLAKVRVLPGDDRYVTPDMCSEVIVVIDSNHSSNKKSDECGIVVMGLYRGKVYTFADASEGGGPKAWGETIIDVLAAFPEINKIVVEDDKSLVLDVVSRVLKERLEEIGRPIKVEPIYHRNKSKKERADPVAVLVQVQKVLLCSYSPKHPKWGDFTLLEWQWKSWNPKDPKAKSPDRVDAHVYGGTYFLLTGRQSDSFAVL